MKKRILSVTLSVILVIFLCSCSGDEKAYETSKAAYDQIEIAYGITEAFGTDIYEAWRMGIYDDEEVIDQGTSYLADDLNLSADELKDGIAYLILGSNATEDEKNELRRSADDLFRAFEDDLFSFCVLAVSNAYQANGKADMAKDALDEAKSLMKEMSDKYSDYEHYPNLKDYYTTTSSFFDFCLNPSGTFEQVKTTINDYRNEARNYISDLDYIFED